MPQPISLTGTRAHRSFRVFALLALGLLVGCYQMFPSTTHADSVFAKDPDYIKRSGTRNPLLTKDAVIQLAKDRVEYDCAILQIDSIDATITDVGYKTAESCFSFPAASAWLVTMKGDFALYDDKSPMTIHYHDVKVAISFDTGQLMGTAILSSELTVNPGVIPRPSGLRKRRYLFHPVNGPTFPPSPPMWE